MTDSTEDPAAQGEGRQPTEEELRAAYEAELKRIRVEDVIVQTVVSLINLGGRKSGLAPGAEDEADPEQLRLAIEAARALLPLVEHELGQDAARVREALSQLQMAYAQAASKPSASGGTPPPDGGEGPAQQGQQGGPGESAVASGRLWVPGQ
jgi:hypothetical protein